MNNKEDNFKEKFKKALISTAKVISGDYKLDLDSKDKNSSSKNLDFFELDNLEDKHDFIRLRAETDSKALKQKFSNKEIYQKNLPNNKLIFGGKNNAGNAIKKTVVMPVYKKKLNNNDFKSSI